MTALQVIKRIFDICLNVLYMPLDFIGVHFNMYGFMIFSIVATIILTAILRFFHSRD